MRSLFGLLIIIHDGSSSELLPRRMSCHCLVLFFLYMSACVRMFFYLMEGCPDSILPVLGFNIFLVVLIVLIVIISTNIAVAASLTHLILTHN